MKLFGFTLTRAAKIQEACMYKNEADSVCTFLAGIVTDRDNRMLAQFTEQNKLITKHHQDVIFELRKQDASTKTELTDLQKRMIAVENYTKPRNMLVFDTALRYKWVLILFVLLSFIADLILYLHIS